MTGSGRSRHSRPVLFLFVPGTGLSALAGRGLPPGIDISAFAYPGVLWMSVLFTAISPAVSIVWRRDRAIPLLSSG